MNQTETSPQNAAGSGANAEEIRRIYAGRDATKGDRYAFWQPDLRLQMARREWSLAAFLKHAFDGQLGDLDVLDVGCGKGEFLRKLAEWGATPSRLTGTELLEDRLQRAHILSPPDMTWHMGDLESLDKRGPYDLVSAFTVFSSVLDQQLRETLAAQMWERVKPGGWVLIFDFRMNNPNNPNVRKVTRSELSTWFPGSEQRWESMFLVPPVSRRISPISYTLAELLSLLPFLRSHFLYASRKPLG